MVAAIEQGYPQQQVADSAYRFQQAVERGEKTIVGVNRFRDGVDVPVQTLDIDEDVGTKQRARLERLRNERDDDRATQTLNRLRSMATGQDNLMPPIIEAVRAYVTVGEVCDALRDVWGEYQETPTV